MHYEAVPLFELLIKQSKSLQECNFWDVAESNVKILHSPLIYHRVQCERKWKQQKQTQNIVPQRESEKVWVGTYLSLPTEQPNTLPELSFELHVTNWVGGGDLERSEIIRV